MNETSTAPDAPLVPCDFTATLQVDLHKIAYALYWRTPGHRQAKAWLAHEATKLERRAVAILRDQIKNPIVSVTRTKGKAK